MTVTAGDLVVNSGNAIVHGLVAADRGTAANPSLTFITDSTTGISGAVDNTLVLSTGGAEQFSIVRPAWQHLLMM